MLGPQKIIVFDFDKTLTCDDTLYGFFCEFNQKFKWINSLVFRVVQILTKIGVITNSRMKDIGLRMFLKNARDSEIETFAEVYAKKIRFSKIKERLDAIDDAKVLVVTASFECYVRHCFNQNIIVIGSRIKRCNGVVGLGFNCYGESKVKALEAIGVAKVDEFYTDSYSDMPLAEISNIVYYVKKGEVARVGKL